MAASRTHEPPTRSEIFLAALADPARPSVEASDVVVVVAHPDDETIGCGPQLRRLRGVTVVLVTDGAPRNLFDARNYGFESAESYANARRDELEQALGLAGIPPGSLTRLEVPDQQAAQQLVSITRRLADLFAVSRTAVAMTHAFEGGHPDHDATAFAVTAAARLLCASGQRIAVLEMPLYRADVEGRMRQSFLPDPSSPEVEIALNDEERILARRMAAAHTTQRGLMKAFPLDVVRFRKAPQYDLAALPNAGRLLYEQHDWGMTAERWLTLTQAALHELGLDRSVP